MEYLQRINKSREIACYRLTGEWGDRLDRYVVTTAPTRRLCNVPELVGLEFTRALEDGVTLALRHLPFADDIKRLPPRSVNVVHFLRAGLNFGLRAALGRAYGFNEHSSSFMTSQRSRDALGRWYIRDDQYRKLDLPPNATLFFGDIIATGVTVTNGMNVIFNLSKNLGNPIRNIVFFTIGCHKLEKILREFDRRLRTAFKGYEKTVIVYLEGKFHLADSKTEVSIKLQGTDLMRFPGVLTPEFELSQFKEISYPLERCVIYDGGSRAFDAEEYFRDLRDYWERVRKLGDGGLTLYDAMKERWPAREYELPFREFAQAKRTVWKNADTLFLRRLYQAYRKRWNRRFLRKARTPSALVSLCNARLKAIT